MNQDKAKRLLFSVTLADCDLQTFCSGGPGGQHQNKTETGVRIIHRASGAVGESREERSQYANKQRAFKRMAQTKEFREWHRMTVARLLGQPSPEEVVEKLMHPKNIRVDVKDGNGRWVPESEQGEEA